MLSRLNLRNNQLLPIVNHGVQYMSSSANPPAVQKKHRPPRLIDPSPVRFGFIPEEWFTIFYNKTGVTGPYVFGIGVTTYLTSKEFYVVEHEFYNGLSLVILLTFVIKKYGPSFAAYVDKNIDEIEQHWKNYRKEELAAYENAIEQSKLTQWQAEGQKFLFDAKRTNIKMQLEAAYRERLATVYTEVKKRLDYQVQIQNVERRLSQRHMIQWIIDNVLKSITPEQQKVALQQCIKDLQVFAARS